MPMKSEEQMAMLVH